MIREMVKEDIEQVQEVARNSWSTTYEGIIPYQIQENFLNRAYNDEMMEKRVGQSYIFVAEKENRIVGFANFTPVNNEGQSELSAIYLDQDFQGEGIGTALLQRGIKELENLKELYLDVEKENTIGKAFYDSNGFKTEKERSEEHTTELQSRFDHVGRRLLEKK